MDFTLNVINEQQQLERASSAEAVNNGNGNRNRTQAMII